MWKLEVKNWLQYNFDYIDYKFYTIKNTIYKVEKQIIIQKSIWTQQRRQNSQSLVYI